jgi:hypothetical protein
MAIQHAQASPSLVSTSARFGPAALTCQHGGCAALSARTRVRMLKSRLAELLSMHSGVYFAGDSSGESWD